MSETASLNANQLEYVENKSEAHLEDKIQKDADGDAIEVPEPVEKSEEDCKTTYQLEEEALKKKYGGLLPKKGPLISKDHERAFFDSADWALGKQGGSVGKPKGPLEALRPKLQPTPQQRSRRSAYARTDVEDGGNGTSDDMHCNE